MSLADTFAGAVFIACWLIYQPLLQQMTGGKGAINIDMRAVREAWMRRLMARENRIMDATLLGHLLNSASFFASTNLLVIAAAGGLLFGGEQMLDNLRGLSAGAPAPSWLLAVKVALVVAALGRGLLDFIWAIRQLNFCLALVGAAPERSEVEHHEGFIRAATQVLSPAFSSFNKGVRAYYFALAAAAWLISPWAMAVAAALTLALLLRRQVSSEAALGLREARRVLEAAQRRPD
jgi:uncharacterized membrane protein